MKKLVYVVMEYWCNPKKTGDDYDLYYSFDLNSARSALEDAADRGYRINRKSPKDVKYVIFGYEVDTDEINEDEEYDINDPRSLFIAYSLSRAWSDHVFDEEYEIKKDTDNDVEDEYDDD